MDVDGGGGISVVEAEKKKTPADGEPKSKRRMKTPSQLEILEQTYALETYPSEAFRAELSVKLGLSDRQLQMWFCHRRLKDRKAPTDKRPKKSGSPPSVAGPSAVDANENIAHNADVAKERRLGLNLFGTMELMQQQETLVHKVGTAVPRISKELLPIRRFYEPPLAISEQKAIAFVEAQLGEPLREDGPILGMEFDPLPPGAFGAPIGSVSKARHVALSAMVHGVAHMLSIALANPSAMVHGVAHRLRIALAIFAKALAFKSTPWRAILKILTKPLFLVKIMTNRRPVSEHRVDKVEEAFRVWKEGQAVIRNQLSEILAALVALKQEALFAVSPAASNTQLPMDSFTVPLVAAPTATLPANPHIQTLDITKPEHEEGQQVPNSEIHGKEVHVEVKFVEAANSLGKVKDTSIQHSPSKAHENESVKSGNFSHVIVASDQKKPAGWPCDAKLYEKTDVKSTKGASMGPHEYQFLPEKPSVRNDGYERAVPPHYYGSPTDIQNARVPLPTGKSIMLSNEQVPSAYSLQGQMPSLSFLPQQERQGDHLSPAPGELDITPRIAPLVNVNIDAHVLVHPINGLNKQIVTPDRRIVHDEERSDRKRKLEEARIAKEVEAHEKRIRKELEKQDILRRKREEQMRKEMERQDRERRKEEERMLREKQREEERYQREQRREMERREKFLQKEYIKAEKMRLKDEMRREKEAARLKAANDRAAARRIAKESIELIEDERLELMELAALNRGLSSVLALDSETPQNLDLFKDKLPEFPPKSVHLKKPFGVQPWTESEENIGNLLMVWRFLITFADVLGLWPFTLDEFTRAFHDCDPRLLGEIHIALLRCILKDIEDVARTPATTLAANQNSAAVPGGGHLQIVEGAYAWGFDLLSWQRHLTPLTWPEVLRQFALSAGFGPKVKNRDMKPACLRDEHEGDDCGNVISNLRSGVAAENAVAIMQERGFSSSRRSRHRLTPGTVKFAAFHVLSLEGSNGLSILEVADKIQKSGLRDLTTSKTPEASISAALSRDTKLFERTAPSTYCVRSPYRKDSADAEAILSEARGKIRVYQNGNIDGEEAEDVEKEDAERDQGSESDVADDPDVDDLDAISNLQEASHSSETMRLEDKNYSTYEKMNELMETLPNALGNLKSSSSLSFSRSDGAFGDRYMGVTEFHSNITDTDQENTSIDECGSGESWVQGLTEGEYADLSIEERLNALVALIGVANEGNAIRIALEERLEAANALKKQMWAEAQLDKRRMKEDHILKLHHSSIPGNRAEQISSHHAVEDRKNPILCDIKNEPSCANHALQMVDLNEQQNYQSYCNNIISEKNPSMQEVYLGSSDNLLPQQSVYAAEKPRSELKALIGHQAEEMHVYRSLPLGQDRRRNRYWQFITSPSRSDPGSARIYVELCSGVWRLIDSQEGFDALLSSLDIRGIRESHLHSMLRKIEASFKGTAKRNLLCRISGEHVYSEVNKEVPELRPTHDCYANTDSPKSIIYESHSNSPQPSISFAIELDKIGTEQNDLMNSYKDFEKWMWEECFDSNLLVALKCGRQRCELLLEICSCCHSLFSREDRHCRSCYMTYSTYEKSFNILEHVSEFKRKVNEVFDRGFFNLSLPPRVRLLKAQLAIIEVIILLLGRDLISLCLDHALRFFNCSDNFGLSIYGKKVLAMQASIPSEALESAWSDEYRKSWGTKLHMASTAEELLQILALLENSIKRGFFSANYETTCEIAGRPADSLSLIEEVAVLPWIPQTTAAMALRLVEFDSSIHYTPQHKETCQRDNGAGYFIRVPSRYFGVRSLIDNALLQDNLVDLGNGQTSLKRGRGRPRGPSRARAGKKSHVKAIGSHGRKKGRRSVRSRQKPSAKGLGKKMVNTMADSIIAFDDDTHSTGSLHQTPTEVEVEGGEYVGSSGRSEFEDENNGGDEYDDDFSRKVTNVDIEQHIVNYDEDEEEGNYYVDGYFNSEEGNQSSGSGEHVRNAGDIGGPVSTSSSDYSY
ncbi:hypothetical protein BUALT_Bualt18G0029700 [Buddleja alternifolia]|uniref:Homeobox-DDT domain protein RLT2 n=1 Tax=Buddleja alternifolia TaxID=168488 RepID=A0AAV6W1P8_9LAMI|nr:hypothetical protein BUALT_Bualt18G0029700 [Buddleja alternifolia]